MLTFPCPSCNAKLQVAEEHAGKTVACPECKAKATVPQTSQPIDAITSALSPASAPAAEPTAVTTPENTKSSKRSRKDRDDDDDDDRDDRPRAGRACPLGEGGIAAGMERSMIAMTIIIGVVGVGGCCGGRDLDPALLVPAVQKVRARPPPAPSRSTTSSNSASACKAFMTPINVCRSTAPICR